LHITEKLIPDALLSLDTCESEQSFMLWRFDLIRQVLAMTSERVPLHKQLKNTSNEFLKQI
jgi:hypothetical protein